MERFLLAEIGRDTQTIFDYLKELPKIDMIYNAPPNPKSIAVWYKMAKNKNNAVYSQFIDSLFEIYKYVSPKTLIIEVLENKNIVIQMLNRWGNYNKISVFPITYTAPLRHNKPGMSYCRNQNEIVVATNDAELNTSFNFNYSHEFLNEFFKSNPKYITGFDPCVGKGLLVRYCCNPYGIEMNRERLEESIKTFELK